MREVFPFIIIIIIIIIIIFIIIIIVIIIIIIIVIKQLGSDLYRLAQVKMIKIIQWGDN